MPLPARHLPLLDEGMLRHIYASVRTTMNLAPDVRRLLRRESARRGLTMTVLLETAVRNAYGNKPLRRRLVRENGRLVVAALPGERPVTDARVKEILSEFEW